MDRKEVEAILILGIRKIYAEMKGKPEQEFHVRGQRGNHTIRGALSKYPTQGYQLTHHMDGGLGMPREISRIVGYDSDRGVVINPG